MKSTLPRAIMVLDMSFTLSMYRERNLHVALENRNLNGYFSRVVSVHPFATLFDSGDKRFGNPRLDQVNDEHLFVSGAIGQTRHLSWLAPLNLMYRDGYRLTLAAPGLG